MAMKPAQANEAYMRIIDSFLGMGSIDPAQRQSALEVVANGGSLRNFLKECGIHEDTYASMAGTNFRIPVRPVQKDAITPEAIGLVSAELAHRYRVIPIELRNDGKQLVLAVYDPLTSSASEHLTTATGKELRPFISKGHLEGLIWEYYPLQR